VGWLTGRLMSSFVCWVGGWLFVSQSVGYSVSQLKHQYLDRGEKFFHQCIKQEMSLNTAAPTSYCSKQQTTTTPPHAHTTTLTLHYHTAVCTSQHAAPHGTRQLTVGAFLLSSWWVFLPRVPHLFSCMKNS
jgi:hypothetical protein